MKRIIAAVALVITGVLALPIAAQAYGEVSGPSSVAVGGTGSYVFQNIPGDVPSLNITVNGPGDATLTGTVSTTKPVVGGSASVEVTFPSAGTYAITGSGFGATTGSFTSTITVSVVTPAADSGLPNTGYDPTAIVWFSGGLVLLGGLAVGVLAAVRRSNQDTP